LKERVAPADALLVKRATRAGLICLGKTNQTEFAYSILGINGTLGTPANPFDQKVARIPGGSSSGAAVSLSRGLAASAVGSDTGGSIRVPSGWNGLVGLKTSFGRLPLDGALPLAPSLDSAGPMARDVADAAALFGVLDGRVGAGTPPALDLDGASANELRLVKPGGGLLWRDLADGIGEVLEAALARLAKAGARLTEAEVPEFDEAEAALQQHGPYHGGEAYAIWREVIEARPNLVYRPILERMRAAATLNGLSAETVKATLGALGARLAARIRAEGAVLGPTCAISPPPIAVLEADLDAYAKANARALRNTRLGNFLGVCAITLPCGHDRNGIPVGLMIMGAPGWDERLLRIGKALEKVLSFR
jgi:aspartyl-tRNA(Asn)/glutamyl-tRNA(Gln) amidotransferase subunit A